MNIPDKAVQAAAKADYETNPGMLEWEEMHPKDQEIFIHSAEASLKAAAPFIAAQALRDLADVMHREGGHFEEVDRDNPRAIEWTAAIQSYSKRVRVLAEDTEREQ